MGFLGKVLGGVKKAVKKVAGVAKKAVGYTPAGLALKGATSIFGGRSVGSVALRTVSEGGQKLRVSLFGELSKTKRRRRKRSSVISHEKMA